MICPKHNIKFSPEQTVGNYGAGNNAGYKTDAANQLMKESASILSDAVRGARIDAHTINDQTIRRFANALAKTEAVLNTPMMKPLVTSQTMNRLKRMQARCADSEFHIALVGAIKAGKSTLINALLDAELASTEVTPETASLTKFRAAKGRSYVTVSFYSADEWCNCWESAQKNHAEVFMEEYRSLNADQYKPSWLDHAPVQQECDSLASLREEIRRWTSSKSPEHYFVKEVEVGLTGIDLPTEVVFVDTPGLDDVVEYRSNITRDYIDRANAVLVCVNATTLRGEELRTISSVFANTRYHPEKVFIVATQIDRLNNPQKDWAKQSAEWLKYLKGVDCFDDAKLAEQNLIPVSGYLYAMLKKAGDSLSDDETFELESLLSKYRIRMSSLPERRDWLLEQTGIRCFMHRLQTEIVTKYRELYRSDIAEAYQACRDDLMRSLNEIRTGQEEIITISRQSIEEIKKKRDECLARLETAKEDRKALDEQIKSLRGSLKKRMEELTEEIMRTGGV